MNFELDDQTKTILKVLGAAAAALAIYYALKKFGYWDQWFGTPAVLPTGPNPGAPGQQATVANPYVQAAQIMNQTAQGQSLTVQQWADCWQQSPVFPNAPLGYGVAMSITPSMLSYLITANGGNPAAIISAQQFVGLMAGAQQYGVSGIGKSLVPAGTPGWVN